LYLKKVDSKHLLTRWYASNSRLLERKECLFWALAFSPACFRSFTFRTRSISSRHHIPPHLTFCDPSNLPVTTDYWPTNLLSENFFAAFQLSFGSPHPSGDLWRQSGRLVCLRILYSTQYSYWDFSRRVPSFHFSPQK